MDHIIRRENEAAQKVREIIARPLPQDRDMMGCEGEFDPWDMFPALYGSYCSDFDQCALDVLSELNEHEYGAKRRDDLAAEMIREMLCVADLCNYGTSPRRCFPNPSFRELLPDLIAKWRSYAVLAWGEGWDGFL